MLIAHRARTSFAIVGAAGTIVCALLLSHQTTPAAIAPDSYGDDGVRVEAKLAIAQILPGAMDHDLAVTIEAPRIDRGARAALSLVIVLDRSGSMGGEPLANAKRAAAKLVQQLTPGDAFSIVTYSDRDETVSEMAFATAEAKRRASAMIELIIDEGGTCISCGIDRGARELAASPITGGLRRMVLISDGQASAGIHDRDELVEFAARTAGRGISISAVGVGLDFDEVTMVRLANVGHGNYYFVEDTAKLEQMLTRELGGLGDTFGTNVKLVLTDRSDTRIEEAYGFPLERAGDHVIIPLADLRAGESRKVVLRVKVAPHATGPLEIAKVELGWQRSLDGVSRHAGTDAVATVVDDTAAVAASFDPTTAYAIETALSARSLEEANRVYESHGLDAARQVLERRGGAINANPYLDAATAQHLRNANHDSIEILRAFPEVQARKLNAIRAYVLAR